MNIYERIHEVNAQNMGKQALSISLDEGGGRGYTYRAMFDGVEAFSARLSAAGLLPGNRVAIIAENSPEWVIAYLAVLKIRCTAVPIDAALSPDDILRLLGTADVSMVLTSPKLLSYVNKWPKGIPVLNLSAMGMPFEGCPCAAAEGAQQIVDGDARIANIIFSSGTTRTAAGIMHTHDAMVNSTQMCLDEIKMGADERFLAILPCSHIYGLVTTLIGPLLIGAEVRHLESLTGEAISKALAEYRPTIFPAVPKMLELFNAQVMRKIDSDKKTKSLFKLFFPICRFMRKTFGLNLGKKLFGSIHDGFGGALDIICSAGAPLDKAVAEFYYGCGFQVLITYGATETNIPTIGNLQRDLTTDTCGKAYPDVEVKIGALGELLIRSPYMMKGYFNDAAATGEAFEDGWFKTGDMGLLDEKGHYRITGRVKDNIVLASGKKVIPDDVQDGYGGIPGVKDFVVCGVPVSAGGCDEIHAFVVLEENIDRQSIGKAIQDRGATLTSSMKIAAVHYIDSIPMTALQKPKRYLLAASVAETGLEKAAAGVAGAGKAAPVSVEDAVIALVAKVGKTDVSLLDGNSKPFSQLGIDSLSAIDLALQIEETFAVRVDDVLGKEMTVSDLVETIEAGQAAGAEGQSAGSNQAPLYPRAKRLRDYNLFRHFCGWARLLYKITVKDENRLPADSGYIVCSNHLSNFDYLWLSINFEKERFTKFCCMAKKELFNNSLVSKNLTRVCGMIPVDRGNVNVGLMQTCKTMLKDKWGLLIYPEGTRSGDGQLGALKNGAAQLAIESDVPIVPAYINGAYEIFPKGKKLPNLFNFKTMRKYPVEVSYGEPISPKNLSVEQLTTLVEQSMVALRAAYMAKIPVAQA